ncbi:MFS transporter [Salinicola corii]|uniref:MFS transporter n=1 Tax=Salinicola corii TaxID=2606937 RepID=A0A640WJ90_9GAMM|nr:MFS transporter [Salinicola corii]KAA0020645.1 MFS transporter [Salinicola corii]
MPIASEQEQSPTERARRNDTTVSATRHWAAVWSLSVGVFGLVTSEFLPASLLTPIADDLGVSVGAVGQAVTATAAIAAVAAVAVIFSRVDRRFLICILSCLLIVSNIGSALAGSLWLFITARAVLGIALGGTWALAAALALRLVPKENVAKAIAIIFAGMTAASVCAPAIGSYLGYLIGWRGAFWAVAGIGSVALVAQLVALPSLRAESTTTWRMLVDLLRYRRIYAGLITVVFVLSAYIAGFTYIRPFLERVTHIGDQWLAVTLLLLGLGGFAGNFAGGWGAGRSSRHASILAAYTVGLTASVLFGGAASFPIALTGIALWGFAFGAFPVSIQTWTTESALNHAENAGALLVATFQVAVMAGASVGGLVENTFGAAGPIGYCAIAALCGGLAMAGLTRRDDT